LRSQGSGSDIVIEADLAELFGRSRIEPQMASTFRNIVAKNATSKLCEGISLESGPGPTALRALAPEQAAYFSTVIQCSFLTSVLKRNSLASALKTFFDKQAEEAPFGHLLRASPSEDGISGFLQACEDQTSLYDWTHLLDTVAAMLGYSERDQAVDELPPIIFRGLLTTLPLVQHFPEEHMIQIECGTGECWIVVWAHYILGLPVLVKSWSNDICTEVSFGPSPPQIIIDARNVVKYMIRESSLTLLGLVDEEGKEPLFHFQPDPDESKIESIYRVPAKGYGKVALFSRVSSFKDISGKEAIIRDMISITCAIAFLISNKLYANPLEQLGDDEWDAEVSEESEDLLEDVDSAEYEEGTGSLREVVPKATPIIIDKERLLEAAKFIFGRQQINAAAIHQYIDFYTGKPLNRGMEGNRMEPPLSVATSFKMNPIGDSYWVKLIESARHLSILIIAFAHVRDLSACTNLMLHHRHSILIDLPLAKILRIWDGTSILYIDEFTWLRAISLLTINDAGRNEDKVALLSDRGWSIYLSTLSLDGPEYTDAGFIVIKRGTPFRNGVYKHRIMDGLDKGQLDISEWQIEKGAGDPISLQCVNQVVLGHPFCGEGRDVFVVTLRMSFQHADIVCTRRTGYRELFSALWAVQRTEGCEHALRKDDEVILAPDFASVSGFDDLDAPSVSERVLICLTANNEIARWRALLAIAHARSKNKLRGYDHVMLRGHDCCLRCAISQTALKLGQWFIVL
jgi:hypothetical protein